MSESLLALVESGLRTTAPGKAAVVSSRGQLTYAELDRSSSSVAAALREAGVARGDRVGVWMDKTPRCVATLLGVLRSGAAYVPLDPRSPWQRCRTIALDCQLAALAIDPPRLELMSRFLEDQHPRVVLSDEPVRGHATRRFDDLAPAGDLPAPAPGDVAYVLYTSGSTGTPKGVTHTHDSGGSFVKWSNDTFAFGPRDVFASHAPFHFDLSILDLWCALSSGGTVRLISSTESMLAQHLVRSLGPWGVTVWYSVPSILVSMLEAGLSQNPPPALRTLLFAGEVFPTPQLRRLRRALPHVALYNLFGPTETNVCTYHQVPAEIPDDRVAPIPIGRGCENLDTFVIDDGGHLVTAIGGEGSLWVRGGNVMTGYWNDAARTARMLRPDPRGLEGLACDTGDRVRILADGGYDFLGRRDHMIKTRGYRVELGEIEAALAAHPAVLHAVAVPLPDPEIGNRLLAFVVLRPDENPDARALRAACTERLPAYMVPEHIEVRAALPQTSTGKADRGALRNEWERRTT